MNIILPEIIKDIEDRVLDTGDIMTGEIKFNNTNSFSFLRKERLVNDIPYQVSLGCGHTEGKGTIAFELQDINNSPDTYTSRLDIHVDKIVFTDINKNKNTLLHTGNKSLILEDYNILTYFSLSQFGCDDSTFSTSDFMANMRIINDKFTHYVNDNVILNLTFRPTEAKGDVINFPNFWKSVIAKVNADLNLTLSEETASIAIQYNLLNRFQPAFLIFSIESSNLTGNYYFCSYNRNGNTDSITTIRKMACERTNPTFSKITVVNTTEKPSALTALPVLNVQYQNGAGNYYSTDVITAIGTGNTENTFNSCFLIGSRNGTTILTAGECGLNMVSKVSAYENENIYLMCDNSILSYVGCSNDASSYTLAQTITSSKITAHVPLYGAVWNDYAEYRMAEVIEPGHVVIEHESGKMKLSTERLQPGAEIISDTFGFAIGETDECKTPIAATGRVLAYPNEDRYSYPLGSAVCSGPNGTVSLMTREEIREYPERIIGTVSEIPEYKTWGTNNIEVKGRIWIRIK